MHINDRDRDLYTGLAGELLDIPEGDARREQAYRQLADELTRNGPRGWLTPNGERSAFPGAAIGLWLDHVRAERKEAAKRAAGARIRNLHRRTREGLSERDAIATLFAWYGDNPRIMAILRDYRDAPEPLPWARLLTLASDAA